MPCLQEQNTNCLCFRIGNEGQVEEEEDAKAQEETKEDEGEVQIDFHFKPFQDYASNIAK